MVENTLDWRIECDREIFEKSQADAKFPFIVALARAVNALNSVHSLMLHAGDGDAPEAERDRMNSYFFASAILYEGIKLVRAMNKTFKDDAAFRNGLHLLLRDPAAQKLEQAHLNPVRNQAVFHFMPDTFSEVINSATVDTCIFAQARGQSRRNLRYSYADVVTSEILVGFAANTEEFYETLGSAMRGTRELVIRFAEIDRLSYCQMWLQIVTGQRIDYYFSILIRQKQSACGPVAFVIGRFRDQPNLHPGR